MPDPSEWFNGHWDNVCAESDGCKITVEQSVIQAGTILDWTFLRSPVVIPVPVPEPGTLLLVALGMLALQVIYRWQAGVSR